MSEVPACAVLLAKEFRQFEVNVATGGGREVPLTVFHPDAPGEYPLIVFSHGAFAAPDRYGNMLGPLAAAGHIVIAPMHVDSEEFDSSQPPSAAQTWQTRNADMALSLGVPRSLIEALQSKGLNIDQSQVIAMGHSYGALMAQLAGGARAIEDDGSKPDRREASVDAVIAWSPPGIIPGRMAPESWRALAVPSLTITGTADVLPGFIDNWEDHKASYDHAPGGSATLWVGEGVDHYFGGLFGREKPADPASQRLFQQALQRALAFAQDNTGAIDRCTPSAIIEGESIETR
ncbi:alpha/beta hydrolase family protein [Erythrobacter sp. W53]|uniref:alpha/beta hydrolase family protein n=1 Tax=Erythrobacter sp. W53 TaxID=3425947 RepID=UPI003D767F44